MNAATSSARPLVVPRVTLFASLALLCAAIALFAPASRVNTTAACPVEPPKPLRALYVGSDRVVVARAGLSRRVEGGEYADHQRRTVFDVSENLKGDPGENRVEITHWVTDDPAHVGNFRKDETVLLFLNRDAGGAGYEINDMRYGVKKLPEADLKIYVKRIEELSYIVNQPQQEQKPQLIEWLVRCAEEPATRWEGAYELTTSHAYMEYEAERQKEAAENAAQSKTAKKEVAGASEAGADSASDAGASAGDASAEGGGEAAESGAAEAESVVEEGIVLSFDERLGMWGAGTDVDGSVVRGLTAAHKKRLADALFASDKMGEGETALVQLVKNWGDERFVPFVLRYLHGVEEEPPYEAVDVVSALAHALKDDSLIKLAADYNTLAPYYDDEEEEETQEEQTTEDESAVNVGEPDNGVEEEAAQEAEAEVSAELKSLESARADDGKKLTAAQRRGRMLRYVLAAAEGKLSEAAQRAEQR